VIGLNLFQGAMLIYSAIQIEQIQDSIVATAANTRLHFDPWPSKSHYQNNEERLAYCCLGVRPFLIAVPAVIGFFSIILFFITWKLFQEFGWTIYKHIGASVQMRRRYLIYQIFVALLKFDFFFCSSLFFSSGLIR
jgi:hypothetical protein